MWRVYLMYEVRENVTLINVRWWCLGLKKSGACEQASEKQAWRSWDDVRIWHFNGIFACVTTCVSVFVSLHPFSAFLCLVREMNRPSHSHTMLLTVGEHRKIPLMCVCNMCVYVCVCVCVLCKIKPNLCIKRPSCDSDGKCRTKEGSCPHN